MLVSIDNENLCRYDSFGNIMNVRTSDIERPDAVYKKSAIYDMLTAMNNLDSSENDLKSFREYLEKEYRADAADGGLGQAITGVQYSYDLGLLVYTKNVDGEIIQSDTQVLMRELLSAYMGADMSSLSSMTDSSSVFGNMSSLESMSATTASSMGMVSMNLWQEMLTGKNGEPINDLLKKQYDVVYGTWPNDYNETVLIDKNNELDDMTLMSGLEPKRDYHMDAALNGIELKKRFKWSYGYMQTEFRIILNSDCYSRDEKTGSYTDLRQTEAGLRYLYDNALNLKVTGIIRPNENAQSAMLSGSIAYTSKLAEYVIDHSKNSSIIADQMENSTTDVLTGLPFKTNTGNLSRKKRKSCENICPVWMKGKASAMCAMSPSPGTIETMTATMGHTALTWKPQ